ncbi:MAG: hypothetical protein HY835_12615 [Anaerolineae bacterium]|nr:hypothetical protein [Anaerolineae bacterium]
MDINLAGRNIPILGYTHLDDEMDEFFRNLYTHFFEKPDITYLEFIKRINGDLRDSIIGYLDRKRGNPPGRDFLFNNLSTIWYEYQKQGRVGEAQQFWDDFLKIVLEWERTRNERIHKGPIYYFWSQTAIFQGQLDKGFFLIHSAVEEDVLTHNSGKPGTPAYLTVSLNNLEKGNLLFNQVNSWANYLDQLISNYRGISNNKLTMDDLREKFLEKCPSRDNLYLFTYTVARFFDLDHIPPTAIKSNFASIYELNMLFDLVLVIDEVILSSIINPGKNDWKFSHLANHLLIESSISKDHALNITHLNNINSRQNRDFENTINELLKQKFKYDDKTFPSRLECDIAIAYCLRNHSAHSVNSYPIIYKRFTEIRQSILNVLFLSVEFL